MHILGINTHHAGSSACLIRDGKVIAADEEERVIRRKYWAGFPTSAVKYVLNNAGITIHDVAHISVSRDPSPRLKEKILYTLSKRPSWNLIRARLDNASRVIDLRKELALALNIEQASLNAEFHNVEHHIAHMASVFLVSPFDTAAILSVDGMGDFISTIWGKGTGIQIDVEESISFPRSLGFFYTALTQWLGFPKYGDEGKVMGLAPYGKSRYMEEMHDIVHLMRDGSFELNLDYFVVHS